MKKSFQKSWALGLTVAALFSIAFQRSTLAEITGKEIKIGVILPMTGSNAILGENEAKVLRASEKVINAARGEKAKVKLVIEDAAGDPKKAATIANLFVSQGVPIVISSTTPLSAPVVPINEQNRSFSVVHSMTESVIQNTKYAVRIYPGILDEVKTVGEWLSKSPKGVSLFVLRLDAEWSAKWVGAFRKARPGIRVTDEIYTAQNPNVRNALAKIGGAGATHIMLLGYGQEYPVILRQIKEAAIDLPILGNISFSYAGMRLKAQLPEDRALLRGCAFPFVDIDLHSAESSRLEEALQSDFKMDLLHEPTALYLYDTLKMLLEAVDAVSLDSAAIREYLVTKLKAYHGLTGLIEMNADGNSTVHLKMAHYGENGEIQFFESVAGK